MLRVLDPKQFPRIVRVVSPHFISIELILLVCLNIHGIGVTYFHKVLVNFFNSQSYSAPPLGLCLALHNFRPDPYGLGVKIQGFGGWGFWGFGVSGFGDFGCQGVQGSGSEVQGLGFRGQCNALNFEVVNYYKIVIEIVIINIPIQITCPSKTTKTTTGWALQILVDPHIGSSCSSDSLLVIVLLFISKIWHNTLESPSNILVLCQGYTKTTP